jgi:hypothetical protein
MFLFECKTDIGQLRPDQVIRLQQWRKSGAAAVEIRSLDQAKEILRGLGFVDVGKT